MKSILIYSTVKQWYFFARDNDMFYKYNLDEKKCFIKYNLDDKILQ